MKWILHSGCACFKKDTVGKDNKISPKELNLINKNFKFTTRFFSKDNRFFVLFQLKMVKGGQIQLYFKLFLSFQYQ